MIKIPKRDVFYCEGHGDIVNSYVSWRQGIDCLSETSITFSSQIFEACNSANSTLFALSHNTNCSLINDTRFSVANLPKWNFNIPKIGYDLSSLIYTLRILRLALRSNPRVIFLAGGVDLRFAFLLRLSGAKIVPVLHNTLWPVGFPPKGPKAFVYKHIERILWRKIEVALAVSPAAARQAIERGARRTMIFKPLFPDSSFSAEITPKDWNERPFRVLFAGRLEDAKGVFDLLEMARQLKPHVEFTLCGDGSATPRVKELIEKWGLKDSVVLLGKLDRTNLVREYINTHVTIVPTRNTFSEGFAMVAAESILLLRPVITSPVVPAAETLEPAVLLARTNDIDSYVNLIRSICTDKTEYQRLVEGARRLRSEILDKSCSFKVLAQSVIEAAIKPKQKQS